MNLPDSPSFCDDSNPNYRAKMLLEWYFPDIKRATQDDFSLRTLLEAASILDVGCGKGALGIALNTCGYLGKLYGVDPVRWNAGYIRYESICLRSITNQHAPIELGLRRYDIIYSFGLPSKVNAFLTSKTYTDLLSRRGKIFIASDDPIEVGVDWKRYTGDKMANQYIYLFRLVDDEGLEPPTSSV